MRNIWKGLVVGAISGAAAGLALDRHAPSGRTPMPGRDSLLTVLGQGLSHVGDRVHDSTAPHDWVQAADVLQRRVRDLPSTPRRPTWLALVWPRQPNSPLNSPDLSRRARSTRSRSAE